MEEKVWERINYTRLTLDQTSTPVYIDRAEVENFYAPLGLYLLKKSRERKRLMVVVSGPPGSGKTVFAMLLVAVINAEAYHEEAVQIPLDGWHYPNEYLDTHTTRYADHDVLLRQIKGSPATYDTAAAFSCLEKIRKGGQISYPVYSRIQHDPIANGGMVEPFHKIVILEGNYWLLQDVPWTKFQRQLRGGRSAEAIEQQITNVDLPNIEFVLKNSARADIVVHKADNSHIINVEYLNNVDLG
jgi:pantothenate kinase